MVTETDELAAALNSAASRYPGLTRAQLLTRLALEGQQVAQRAQEDRRRQRLAALRGHSGALTGAYGEHYLERLRQEGPAGSGSTPACSSPTSMTKTLSITRPSRCSHGRSTTNSPPTLSRSRRCSSALPAPAASTPRAWRCRSSRSRNSRFPPTPLFGWPGCVPIRVCGCRIAVSCWPRKMRPRESPPSMSGSSVGPRHLGSSLCALDGHVRDGGVHQLVSEGRHATYAHGRGPRDGPVARPPIKRTRRAAAPWFRRGGANCAP